LVLPQPSYRISNTLARFENKSLGLVRYVDKSMANVGYQETDRFVRPESTYIRASDAYLDEDLDNGAGDAIGVGGVGRVEYDMDDQDDAWLKAHNEDRKRSDTEAITREMFEITMTKIEKEWHALEKRIPKPNPKPPQTHRPRSSSAAAVNGEPQAGEEQDSKCVICDDGDCENTNAIVFCDGCDLAVHQECYGVPFIPEGQWLCRRCQLAGRGIPVSSIPALSSHMR
jgi:NuA3 HAT complex component NTO1